MDTLSQIKVPPCRQARVVSGQTSFANVRPHVVDRARRRNADLSHEGGAAIAATPHAAVLIIDIGAGDSIEIGVVFK
jgi:hypothetical protein